MVRLYDHQLDFTFCTKRGIKIDLMFGLRVYAFRCRWCSFSPNKIVVCLTVGFTILFGIALYVEWFVFEPFLGYFTLFFGVFIGYYSVFDIYDGKGRPSFVMNQFGLRNNSLMYFVFCIYFFFSIKDLIKRSVEGSDAQSCHKVVPCCFPRCVGLQFAFCALVFQAVGLYLGLVWMFTSLDH